MQLGPAALALALALGVSCARNPQPSSSDQAPVPVTILRVDNQSVLDMDIFVVRDVGDRLRIGFVNSHDVADLRIPPTFVFGATPLRFLADPVGSRARSVSQEITVSPGDTVVMTIPR